MSEGPKWCKMFYIHGAKYFLLDSDQGTLVVYVLACSHRDIFVAGYKKVHFDQSPFKESQTCCSEDVHRMGRSNCCLNVAPV